MRLIKPKHLFSPCLVFQNDDVTVLRYDGSGQVEEQVVEDVKRGNFHGANYIFLFKQHVNVLTPHVLGHHVNDHVRIALIPEGIKQ